MFSELYGGQLEFYSREEIERLHIATLSILERTGVRVQNEAALKLLEENGADVDHKGQVARLPPALVTECIRKAGPHVDFSSIDPTYNNKLGGSRVHFATGGTATYVLDLETKEKRSATVKDVEDFSKLTTMLDTMSIFHICCNPEDVPNRVKDLHRWRAAFKYCSKHLMNGIYDIDTLHTLIEAGTIVAGDKKTLVRNPVFSIIITSVGPLTHTELNTDILMECARERIPVIVSNDVMAGASGPVTLAGTVAVTNAETLTGVCIAQLTNPGCPVLMGNTSTIMDMRGGTLAEGAPEQSLINMAMTQLSRYYKIPIYGTGGTTDAKEPNAQSGWEKGITSLLAALSGSNIVHANGGFLDSISSVSLAQLVIDDDISGHITRIMKGMEISDDTLVLDLIDETGPGGNFMIKKHTRQNWKDVQWAPRIAERRNYDAWKREGGKSTYDKAREVATRMLGEYPGPFLDEDVLKEIDKVMDDAIKSKLGGGP